MKRFRLATKLALAIVPVLIVALVAGALVSWNFLEQARGEERVALAARVADAAMNVLIDVSAEQTLAMGVALGTSDRSLDSARSAVDSELTGLSAAVEDLVPISSGPASGIASRIVSETRRVSSLVADARGGDPLGEEANAVVDEIGNTLVSIVSQTILYFDTADRSREGAGATALGRAAVTSFRQQRLMAVFPVDAPAVERQAFEQQVLTLETTVADWLVNAEEVSPTVGALNLVNTQLTDDPAEILAPDSFPTGRDDILSRRSSEIFNRVAIAADAAADTARSEAGTIGAVVVGVLVAAILTALLVGRSIVRRVRAVTDAARNIAEVDLPQMVDALSDPRGRLSATASSNLDVSGHDEVGELSRSFGSLHSTLVDVANQQMEMLRRGVSEIFVTLARRNRSLVDRQLALIDDLESNEDDPDVLGGYYKLDHLATRMRRNAESLLVLAGAETRRMWAEPLEVGDVVRAALGEVDEYQRVDVLAVEPARVTGRAVTDLAHLLSELLDNATHFSPPTERVRVAGLFDDQGYIITISDNGIGLSDERLAEVNHLLEEPPILGLALEPTLGMYVVARLANRHGINVRMVAGVPGVTVRITLPRDLLEPGAHAAPSHPAAVVAQPPVPAEAAVEPDRAPGTVADAATEPEEAAPLVGGTTIPDYAFRSPNRHVPHRPTPSRDRTAPPPAPARRPTDLPAASLPAASPDVPLPHRVMPVAEERLAPPVSSTPAAARLEPARRQPATTEPTGENPVSATPEPPDDEPIVNPLTGLPTRTPGAAFSEDPGAAASTTSSLRGAAGIRDALVGFKLGRDTAAEEDRSRPIDRPIGREPTDEPGSTE